MAHQPNTLSVSRHFQLEQLAEGIYAALSINGTGSMSNAGIVDLGEATLIFDTFATAQAAQDLRSAAEQLIGHPIAYVVNSHRDGALVGQSGFPLQCCYHLYRKDPYGSARTWGYEQRENAFKHRK